MTLVSLKQSGMYLSIVSLDNQIGFLPRVKFTKFAHVTIFRLTVGTEQLNLTAKSCPKSPALRRLRNKNNSSMSTIHLFRPDKLIVSLA